MYERTHRLDRAGKVVARPAVSDLPARHEKDGMYIRLACCYRASLDATPNNRTMLVIAITDQQGLLRQLHGRRIDPIHLHGGGTAHVVINASFAPNNFFNLSGPALNRVASILSDSGLFAVPELTEALVEIQNETAWT